jgi:hypothetical protein
MCFTIQCHPVKEVSSKFDTQVPLQANSEFNDDNTVEHKYNAA